MRHIKHNDRTYSCFDPRMEDGKLTCEAWSRVSNKKIVSKLTLHELAILVMRGNGIEKNCERTCKGCKEYSLCTTEILNIEDVTDEEILAKAAEVSARVAQAEAVKSANKIRGTWFQVFSQMNEAERWREYARYRIPSLHDREAIPAGNGLPGGGSSSRNKKSAKGNKPTEYVWGE